MTGCIIPRRGPHELDNFGSQHTLFDALHSPADTCAGSNHDGGRGDNATERNEAEERPPFVSVQSLSAGRACYSLVSRKDRTVNVYTPLPRCSKDVATRR